MSLEFPGPGGRLDAKQSRTPLEGPSRPRLRSFLGLLFPILLSVLNGGCHHHSDPNATGTPPSITLQPVDTSTVSGRPVSFTVTANGAQVLTYQWAKDGAPIFGSQVQGATFTLYNPQPADSGHYSVTVTNDFGSATSSAAALTVAQAPEFTAAVGVVADATGNLFVSDRDDHVVWKVSPANQVTLLAGTKGIAGSADGPGSSAQFRNPGCLAFDPAGNLVLADTGNHTIRRIAPDGTVTTLAGSPGLPGTTDAIGSAARFNAPYGIAVSATGTVYVSDSQNHTIRLLAPDGTVSTYAGTPGVSGHGNGSSSSAQFDQPNGLALATDGTLFVSDYGNACIRVISPGAQVSTLAGNAGTVGYFDATGTAALFNQPVGIALDASGNVWVTDTHNHAIRRITPAGVVNAMAGSGLAGNIDGTGAVAQFNLPCGITLSSGNLIVADTANHLLRRVTPAGVVTTLTVP
jgi:sugar lactone lactonase YvrE